MSLSIMSGTEVQMKYPKLSQYVPRSMFLRRSYEVQSRSYEILSCSNEMQCRSYEITRYDLVVTRCDLVVTRYWLLYK